MIHFVNPAGVGSGVYKEANGLYLHQERAELAGWPHAREQEEEAWGCWRGIVAAHKLCTTECTALNSCSHALKLHFILFSGGGAEHTGRRRSGASAIGRIQVRYETVYVTL